MALTELAPAQQDRLDQAVGRVIDELDPAPETFYGRNRIVLEKLGVALKAWKSAPVHEASVDRALARMDAVCQKLPAAAPERAVCRDVLRRSSPSG